MNVGATRVPTTARGHVHRRAPTVSTRTRAFRSRMAAPTPPPRASAPPFEHDAGATAPSIHSTIFESRRKVLLAQNSAILVPLPANDLPPILPLAQDCGRRSRGLRARDRGSRRAGRERRQCRAQCPPRSVRGKLGDQRDAGSSTSRYGRVKDAQAILAYLHASHDGIATPVRSMTTRTH